MLDLVQLYALKITSEHAFPTGKNGKDNYQTPSGNLEIYTEGSKLELALVYAQEPSYGALFKVTSS